jgi:hypothetical protein
MGVLAVGATTLCVLGLRNGTDLEHNNVISRYLLGAVVAVCAPIALAAFAPERTWLRVIFLTAVVSFGTALSAVAFGLLSNAPVALSPAIVGCSFGLFLFLIALSPFTQNAIRLGVLAPIAALVGVAGGVGYLMLQDVLVSALSASAAAIALAGGIVVGVGVGADFAHYFAKGANARNAAAAAGHAALAPAMFSVLAAASYAGIATFHANFGMADARLIFGVGIITLFGVLTALAGATGALALIRPSEQTAVNENRRRARFAESWRPVRRILPSTTALASSAIIGVIVIIALFEVGIDAPLSLAAYILLIVAAAGLTFVSLRTSILIAALLFVSSIYAEYIYAIFGLTLLPLTERLAALTLAAIAFSQLTVSWRNASDVWRNARDITQNAMCDGLRRFLIALGGASAALVVASYAFDWSAGISTACYFTIVACIGLFMSPVLMVALSANTQRY